MSVLVERFPKLSNVPRVKLARLPTPLERMAGLSKRFDVELWCKRDDRTSRLYGGNKVRKLEFLIGEALATGADSLITAGAFGSHHALATALFGREQGLEVHLVLAPQPWTAHVEENLRADIGAAAKLHLTRSFGLVPARMLALAAELRLKGSKPYVIPPGGSSPTGALGYVEAGLEIGKALDEGKMPEPRTVYAAFGTGGTAAGLAVGLAAAGVTARIEAVRVTEKLISTRRVLRTLVDGCVRRLRAVEPRFPDVRDAAMRLLEIDARQLGPGYGRATDEATAAAEACLREDGIVLETTYTAKALAGLLRDVRHGEPSIYVHTLSSADLSGLVDREASLPRAVLRAWGRA